MISIFSVAIGSALGGVSRFLISKALNPVFCFPLGTFAVNILGCFILGFLNGYTRKSKILTPEVRLCFSAGFCGSFTTFSTFLFESSKIFSSEKTLAILYAISSLAVGIAAVLLGHFLATKFEN